MSAAAWHRRRSPTARRWRRFYRSGMSPLGATDQIIVRHVTSACNRRTKSSRRCSPATARGGAGGSGWERVRTLSLARLCCIEDGGRGLCIWNLIGVAKTHHMSRIEGSRLQPSMALMVTKELFHLPQSPSYAFTFHRPHDITITTVPVTCGKYSYSYKATSRNLSSNKAISGGNQIK
jgi:hypothetical protein